MRVPLLAILTLVLVLSGCGRTTGSGEASQAPPPAASTTTTTSTAPAGPFGAMSIVRTDNGFTLTGEVPDANFKASLLDTLRQAMPGAKIVDHLTVKPGVAAPEIAGLGALFGVAMDVEGFGVNLVGDTATLTGSAKSAAVKATAESAVKTTWPNVAVVDDIRVG